MFRSYDKYLLRLVHRKPNVVLRRSQVKGFVSRGTRRKGDLECSTWNTTCGVSTSVHAIRCGLPNLTLFENDQPAAQRFQKRIRRPPAQRGDQCFRDVAGCASKQKDLPPRLDERLKRHQDTRLDANRANR